MSTRTEFDAPSTSKVNENVKSKRDALTVKIWIPQIISELKELKNKTDMIYNEIVKEQDRKVHIFFIFIFYKHNLISIIRLIFVRIFK